MMTNVAVNDYLNKLVATDGVFYTRLHQFHWHLQGPHFFTLHVKFEDLYNEFTEDMDLIAERLLAVGGKPYATLSEFLENSEIKENVADKDLSEEDMVKALVADLETINALYDEGIHLTDEEADYPTNDMLIAMKNDVEKHLWMFKAFLGEDA